METDLSRLDFIGKVFKFYKVIDENGELKRTYDRALSVKYAVDWNALYEHILKSAETRILPLPKYFVDKLSQYKKLTQTEIADEGCIIRVTLDNGYYYDFTIVSFDAKTTLDSIKKRFSYKDENGNAHTKIKKIVRYPRETTFIGDKVYFNVNFSNAAKMSDAERETTIALKEKELENQIKVLFTAL